MEKFQENNILEDKKVCVNENEEAWNKETYNAWVKRFGTAKEAAEKIKAMPEKKLNVLLDKFGDVKGKKIFNLMGSNGNKAVALALLGADVTVVDFSEGNRRYALDLAEACGVKINFILSDVLKMPKEVMSGDYDIVFAEMGILHYFSDLAPFMNVINSLLKNGGKAVLRDFHPVSTKLITSRGSTAKVRKHKVTGDYFDTSLEEKEVAYSKYLEEGEVEKVFLRKWNLGEIVTAVANTGLKIESLTEEPNLSSDVFDKGIPKTFTIVARK
ncbi:class I SAM-dependent methyltransferase [Clostridium perfringens]|uniref:Class I SAM-dependent methyltransferase n=1 Tax=Clostridium perfringens TaxID=1502 RepID=A0AAP4ABX5_CLOPF|nr:class I SAM-dependent methyltransferase [Clostridium perfringens]MDH2336884.1 class I SAM-dependent methyltransferase [Clostridium perfringens]